MRFTRYFSFWLPVVVDAAAFVVNVFVTVLRAFPCPFFFFLPSFLPSFLLPPSFFFSRCVRLQVTQKLLEAEHRRLAQEVIDSPTPPPLNGTDFHSLAQK